MEPIFSRPRVQDGRKQVFRLGSWRQLRQSGYSFQNLSELFDEGVEAVWLSRSVYAYAADAHPLSDNHTDHLYICTDQESVEDRTVCICSVTAAEPTLEYQQVFQWIAQTPVDRLEMISTATRNNVFPSSAETLSSMLDFCRSHRKLSFIGFDFSPEQCHVLASFRGSVRFYGCTLGDSGRSIFETIGDNRGPQDLDLYMMAVDSIDSLSLQNALRTTTSLRTLGINVSLNQQFSRSLGQNQSLRELELHYSGTISENEWADIFAAVRVHPTLEKITFRGYIPRVDTTREARVARTRVIWDALQENTVLLEIHVHPSLIDEQFWDDQIGPRLKVNRYRPLVRQLVEESDGRLQRQLFGAATLQYEVNRNPSLMFLLLSNFHDLLSELNTDDEDTGRVSAGPGRASKRRRLTR